MEVVEAGSCREEAEAAERFSVVLAGHARNTKVLQSFTLHVTPPRCHNTVLTRMPVYVIEIKKDRVCVHNNGPPPHHHVLSTALLLHLSCSNLFINGVGGELPWQSNKVVEYTVRRGLPRTPCTKVDEHERNDGEQKRNRAHIKPMGDAHGSTPQHSAKPVAHQAMSKHLPGCVAQVG